MDQLRNIRDETAALAALARPERLAMLRRLMGEPATITQLCQDLGHYPDVSATMSSCSSEPVWSA